MIAWIQGRLVNLVNSFKIHLSANHLPNTLLDVEDLRMGNKDTILSMSSLCGEKGKFGSRASKQNIALAYSNCYNDFLLSVFGFWGTGSY